MKKITLLSLILALCLQNQSAFANENPRPVSKNEMTVASAEKEHVNNLLIRLNTIKDMDKSHLNRSEKKILRKEVNTINKELVKTNGGIYLSVGAVLLVILLLIILL